MNIYVNNRPISLGSGANVSLNTCNSLLHTSEPFTFSFDLPLDSNNRTIFGSPSHGWQSANPLTARISGLLREEIFGNVVITRYTLDTISIRFQSWSSAINQFFKEKPKLEDWDLGSYKVGSLTLFPFSTPAVYADGVWYNRLCFSGYDSPWVQKWGVDEINRNSYWHSYGSYSWLPCPYVKDVLKALFGKIGVRFDPPQDPILQKLILIGVQSNNVSESIGSMKIKDLIDSVEFLTGSRFVVHLGATPIVSLVPSEDFVSSLQEISPNHVISYEKKILESSNPPDYAKRIKIGFSRSPLEVSKEHFLNVPLGDIQEVKNWLQGFYLAGQGEKVRAFLGQQFFVDGSSWVLEWLGYIPIDPTAPGAYSVDLCAIRPNKRFSEEGESVDLPLRFASVEHSFVVNFADIEYSPRGSKIVEKETSISMPFYYLDRQGVDSKDPQPFVYDRLKNGSSSSFEVFLALDENKGTLEDKNGNLFPIYPYGYDDAECRMMRIGELKTPEPTRLRERVRGLSGSSLISTFDFSEQVTIDLLSSEIVEGSYLYSFRGETLLLDFVEIESGNREWCRAHFFPKKKPKRQDDTIRSFDFPQVKHF